MNRKELNQFVKTVGYLVAIIEEHALKMRERPLIFSKDNNYLVDMHKSKKFLEYITLNQ